jgi:hypothetical protein
MKTTTLACALLLTTAASAQITPLGGGTSPLFVSGTPTIGSTLQISPLIAPLPAVVLGLTRADVPMTSIGANCSSVLVPDLDLITLVTYQVSIPNDPMLVDFTFYAQGVLFGAGLCQLDFYFGLSNAVEIKIQ